MNNTFWKKKTFVSFILSILILCIHTSSFSQYTPSETLISTVNQKVHFFFSESITRFAVPMFFILSGIAFFKGYDNSKYLSKIKSRIHSLLIPYLIWNILWMLFNIACSYTFISQYYVGRQAFSLSLVNLLRGVFFYGCNGPFWYVFNLMVFSLAAPLLFLLIRKKYVGISLALFLSVLQIFNIGLPPSIFYYPSSIIYYIIGAIIGKHYFSFVEKKASLKVQLFSVCYLAIFVILRNLLPNVSYRCKSFVEIIVFTLCAYSVWCLLDAFVDRVKDRPIYSRSFALYAMHVDVSAVITKVIMLVLPKSEWLASLNYILTVILTVLCINLFCVVLDHYFPSVYSVLLGGRKTQEKVNNGKITKGASL